MQVSNLVVATTSKGFEQYTKNAYRVLGLVGTASLKEVTEASKKLRRANKIGKSYEAEWDLPWMGPVRRTDIEIQNAESRLTDPESRLLERFFWLHEPSLDSQSVDSLCEKWLQSKKTWAEHDVAVVRTIAACITDPTLSKEAVWPEVIESWVGVANAEDYWLLLMDLDQEGEFEPAVTGAEVSDLRDSCLKVALNPIVVMARDAIAENDTSTAHRAFKLLNNKAIPQEVRSLFEQDIAGLLEEELESACIKLKEDCGSQIKRDKDNTKEEIEKNLVACHEIKKHSSSDIKPRLENMIAIFGDETDAVLRGRAQVADCLRSLSLAYTWADSRKDSAEVLQQAVLLAKGTPEEDNLKQQLTSAKEQAEFEEDFEANEESYKTHHAYEVKLIGTAYRLPQVCPCCLGKPDTTISLSYEWEENFVVYRRTKSVRFTFPYCKQCLAHASELASKRFLLILATAISTGAFAVLFNVFENNMFWVFNLVLCIFFAFLWSKAIKVRELHSHCTRSDAVQIRTANDHGVTFRFWNQYYAEVFSRFNNTQVYTARASKHSFGSSLFTGKTRPQIVIWSTLFSLLPFFWMVHGSPGNSTNSSMSGKEPQAETVTQEKPAATTPEQSSTSDSDLEQQKRELKMTSLKEKLEAGRELIKQLETKFTTQKEQLDTLKDQIAPYKDSLKTYEDQIAQGVEIDQASYEQSVNDHNALVKQINSLLKRHDKDYAEYEKLLKQDKRLVGEYNALARQ